MADMRTPFKLDRLDAPAFALRIFCVGFHILPSDERIFVRVKIAPAGPDDGWRMLVELPRRPSGYPPPAREVVSSTGDLGGFQISGMECAELRPVRGALLPRG